MDKRTVKIVSHLNKRDYTDEGHVQRLKFAGMVGTVIAEHNSHGECYDVQFAGGVATYDPDELIATLDKNTAARYWEILEHRSDLTEAESQLMVEVIKTLHS